VDVWATGVVLYIMLCGRFPFWGKSDIEYLASLRRGPDMRGEEWDLVSDEGKTFVKTLLELDPHKRPTALQALCLPWVVSSPRPGGGGLGRLESVAGIAQVHEQKQQQRRKITDTQRIVESRVAAAAAAATAAESPVTATDESFSGFDSD
jgi:calcium/calmodulin-dependent protein kinase I